MSVSKISNALHGRTRQAVETSSEDFSLDSDPAFDTPTPATRKRPRSPEASEPRKKLAPASTAPRAVSKVSQASFSSSQTRRYRYQAAQGFNLLEVVVRAPTLTRREQQLINDVIVCFNQTFNRLVNSLQILGASDLKTVIRDIETRFKKKCIELFEKSCPLDIDGHLRFGLSIGEDANIHQHQAVKTILHIQMLRLSR